MSFNTGFFIDTNAVTNYSMLLDGVNEYITIPNDVLYDFTGATPFSIEIWIKSSNLAGARTILDKRNGSAVGLAINNNGGIISLSLNNTSITNQLLVNTTVALSNSTWYQILITYNGSKLDTGVKIYANAANQSLTTTYNTLTGSIAAGQNLILGRNSPAGTPYWLGNIGHCRMWNIELTSTEVSAQYSNRMNGGSVRNTSLVLDFRIDGNSLYNGTNWSFRDYTNNNLTACPVSTNMEYADRVTDIPS